MINIRHACLTATMFTSVIWGQATSAVEPLQTSVLAEHCAQYGKRQTKTEDLCIRYIQGFIDGAVATDERVVSNLDKEYEESFTQRALRTRGRSSRDADLVSRFGPTYYADFCVGSPVPLQEVVAKVAKHLNNPTEKSTRVHLKARDLVYYVMRAEYPCSSDSE